MLPMNIIIPRSKIKGIVKGGSFRAISYFVEVDVRTYESNMHNTTEYVSLRLTRRLHHG